MNFIQQPKRHWQDIPFIQCPNRKKILLGQIGLWSLVVIAVVAGLVIWVPKIQWLIHVLD